MKGENIMVSNSAAPVVRYLDPDRTTGAGHGVHAVLALKNGREAFEVPVCAYTHHPSDGSNGYVVVDVDASDTVRVKVTVNDGTVADVVVPDGPHVLTPEQAEAVACLGGLAEAMGHMAGNFSCNEANAWAEYLRAFPVGAYGDADEFLTMHAEADECGDLHYSGPHASVVAACETESGKTECEECTGVVVAYDTDRAGWYTVPA